jgi:mono/diheme cytochrome c family protein
VHRRAGAQTAERIRRAAVGAGIVVLLIGLGACDASARPSTATPVPTAAQLSEHASEGQAKYITAGCAACHGERGEGGIGPRSSGTQVRLVDLQLLVRSGEMDGVRYAYDELTDQDVANIYLWLRTNPAGDRPTPTPES